MEEYKDSITKNEATVQKNKYFVDYSYILNMIKEFSEKERLSEEDICLLRNTIIQFNATLNSRNDHPSVEVLSTFGAPQTLIKLFFNLPGEIHLSCLRSLDILSQYNIIDHNILVETNLSQYFIDFLNNFSFEGQNEVLTECAEILSIIDNCILDNGGEAEYFMSLDLINSLNDVFMKTATIPVENENEVYIKMVLDNIIRLKNDLLEYFDGIKDDIDFIINAVKVSSPIALICIFKWIESMIIDKEDITAVFSDECFVQIMIENAFDGHNIHAINLVSEYILYDEIAPQLHENIIGFCSSISVGSVLETVNEIVNQSNRRKGDISSGLLAIIGNIFAKLEAIPEEFDPSIIQELGENLKETGTTDEKKSISFLMMELWINTKDEIMSLMSSEEDIDFVLSTVGQLGSDLTHIAIIFIGKLLEEMETKSFDDSSVKETIADFLTDVVEEGTEENSDTASSLLSKYLDK